MDLNIRKEECYDLFSFITFNRPTCKKNIEKLVRLNSTKDRFHLFPIVVDESKRIIDGQHRFEACKILKKPIYYVTDNTEENNWKAITEVNEAGKRHSVEDVYYMLVKNKDPVALYIKTIVTTYSDLPVGGLVRFFINTMYRTDDGESRNISCLEAMKLKKHKLVSNYEFRLVLLEHFIDTYHYFKLSHLERLASILKRLDSPDPGKFLKALRKKGFLPVSQWSAGTFKEELVRHYNKKRVSKKIDL